jgi:hypothetical protein
MRNKIKTIIGFTALAVMMVVFSTKAQTNTAPSFFQTAEQYLTSFNTNFTFQGVSFEAATGYKQVTGVGAASVIDAQYDINRFHILTSFQFSGVGSAFNAEEGGVGYDVIQYYDTALEANLLGGYDETLHSGEIEPRVNLKKKWTYNTYSELGISLPVYFKEKFNNTPSFYLEEGFTF